MKKILPALTALALLIGGAACNRTPQWKIKGTVEGAANKPLIIESAFNGNWYPVDTVTIKADGNFATSLQAPQFPTIYRLSYDGKKAYIPVDSIETIVFTSNADNFDGSYSVSGSKDADNLTLVNSMISQAGPQAYRNDELKRKLAQMLLADPASITAYYIINSTTAEGRTIFDNTDRADLRVIGAVANAFAEQRPNDPRTAFLKNLFLGSKKSMMPESAVSDTIVANEIQFPEITLLDNNGREVSLSQVVAKGPVIISFTHYGAEYSPALNMELAGIYEQYAPSGLEIYQIGFDNDEFQWRQAAKKLPWVTVYNSAAVGSDYLMKYNVRQLPATFIINRKGELSERVTDPTQIKTAIKKYM